MALVSLKKEVNFYKWLFLCPSLDCQYQESNVIESEQSTACVQDLWPNPGSFTTLVIIPLTMLKGRFLYLQTKTECKFTSNVLKLFYFWKCLKKMLMMHCSKELVLDSCCVGCYKNLVLYDYNILFQPAAVSFCCYCDVQINHREIPLCPLHN